MKGYQEDRDEQRVEALLRTANLFLDAKRSVPSPVLRELYGLRYLWRQRRDVPRAVVEACEILDRTKAVT